MKMKQYALNRDAVQGSCVQLKLETAAGKVMAHASSSHQQSISTLSQQDSNHCPTIP